MKSMWKVRVKNAEGDLEEREVVGTLLELATAVGDAPVRVVQWAGDVAPSPGEADSAKGGESVTIDKSEVGDLGSVLGV